MSEETVLDPLQHSVCKECDYLIIRKIIPINPEDFGIDPEDYEEENGFVHIEQSTCVLLNMDLMYVVTACNKFELKGSKTSLLRQKDFLFKS